MSPAEALLWRELRKKPGGFKFRRQFPLHPFSLDFACLEARLAIEVDGEAHDRGNQPQRDAARDAFVREQGFATLRLPAWEVFRNLEGALMAIVAECEARGPLHYAASRRVLERDRVPRTRSWIAGGNPKLQHPPRSGEDL